MLTTFATGGRKECSPAKSNNYRASKEAQYKYKRKGVRITRANATTSQGAGANASQWWRIPSHQTKRNAKRERQGNGARVI
jgi:hypothetical protein